MASGSKERTVFTENSLSERKSTGMKSESIGHRQSILSAYPQDNVHGCDLPDTMGGKLAGSPTNLRHSLTGAGAVQDGPGAAGKVKHEYGD